jgi:peptidoglycan-associated lipoprotein
MTVKNIFKVAKIGLLSLGLVATSCTCGTGKDGMMKRDYSSERVSSINSELRQYDDATVHFAYDKSSLNSKSREILTKVAGVMAKHHSTQFTVEGHCDIRGTEEYNIALGEKRAHAAKKYIEEKNGHANNINVVSYGKSQPIAHGHTDADHAMNRRATVKAND